MLGLFYWSGTWMNRLMLMVSVVGSLYASKRDVVEVTLPLSLYAKDREKIHLITVRGLFVLVVSVDLTFWS